MYPTTVMEHPMRTHTTSTGENRYTGYDGSGLTSSADAVRRAPDRAAVSAAAEIA